MLGAYAIFDAHQNAALPTADVSRPRDAGNNTQTSEAGTSSQLAESASHDLSGGHSTGIETVGTGTGNLRQKTATQLLNEYGCWAHGIIPSNTSNIYLCTGHSDAKPQFGCRVLVNGQPKGNTNNKSSKREVREEAASEAVTSLLMT